VNINRLHTVTSEFRHCVAFNTTQHVKRDPADIHCSTDICDWDICITLAPFMEHFVTPGRYTHLSHVGFLFRLQVQREGTLPYLMSLYKAFYLFLVSDSVNM
jgi:hypothetical protein